jgi:phospholipid transport system substrate-binding protein
VFLKRLFALGFLLLWAFSTQTVAVGPDELVKRTADRVLKKVMANKASMKANPSKLYGLVNSSVAPHFDFGAMSRSVLGKHWRKASKSERNSFVKEFKKLLIRTYASALLNYSGQRIDYKPAKISGKSAVVKSLVRGGGGPALPIDYRLRKGGGRWKVTDLKVDGVSLISNYRTNFSSKVRRVGVSGLIKEMRAK